MTNNKIRYYFELAAKVARLGNTRVRDFLVGAVAIRRDGVLVASRNGSSHQSNPTAHAEYRVLKKAGLHSILFVVRVAKKDGSYRIAKPCSSCQAFMSEKRVDVCYYTKNDGTFGIL